MKALEKFLENPKERSDISGTFMYLTDHTDEPSNRRDGLTRLWASNWPRTKRKPRNFEPVGRLDWRLGNYPVLVFCAQTKTQGSSAKLSQNWNADELLTFRVTFWAKGRSSGIPAYHFGLLAHSRVGTEKAPKKHNQIWAPGQRISSMADINSPGHYYPWIN